ncbi:hypothetical protein B0E46_05090 [Rhodanobacter sp. B04]|nr:hypothetical protein B0E46_05090 [Rhodanobacter sp. B04]
MHFFRQGKHIMFFGSGAKGMAWAAVTLLLITGCTASVPKPSVSQDSNGAVAMPVRAATSPHLFSQQEIQAFVTAAQKADAHADPLQRCLAFPDPPGSHWTPVAVKAYCQYLYQSVPSVEEVTQLIQGGHASQLDRLMAEALVAQRSDPASAGKLEDIFVEDFSDVTPALRAALDEWKRQSPQSAFAYAASGFAYESAAYDARGKDYAVNTPAANLMSMDSLLKLAIVDLQKAVQLNPQITPAYAAMIEAAGISSNKVFGEDAAREGLHVDPTSYRIYGEWLWMSEPKWLGSLSEMSSVIAQVQPHVSSAPLLTVLLSGRKVYEADMQDCDCNSVDQLAQYPVVFDQVALSGELAHAGYAAHESHHPELAVVYLSEALRFDPSISKARQERDADLAGMMATGTLKDGALPDVVTQTIGPPVAQAQTVGYEPPSLISMGTIEYPEEARQALISGTVVTLTYVGKDGVPIKCIVESQSFVQNARDKAGYIVPQKAAYSIVRKDGSSVALADLLDPPAIRAMMQARFNPGKRAGVAIVSIVRMPVAFNIFRK